MTNLSRKSWPCLLGLATLLVATLGSLAQQPIAPPALVPAPIVEVIKVLEALEFTKQHGIRFKPPKSKAGRRDITLPDILVDLLREYRKAQLELRMRLGAGKLQDTDLLFADLNGGPLSPNAISAAWSDYAKQIGMPEVTFHSLRHTHASQLIDAGVVIVTINRRLGHAKPDITLRI